MMKQDKAINKVLARKEVSLSHDFQYKTMLLIHKEAAKREQRNLILQLLLVSMVFAVFIFSIVYFFDFSIDFNFKIINLKEFGQDLSSYKFSILVGFIALFLLITDSLLRKAYEAKRKI